MIKICLTGSIATGKTVVSGFMKEAGVIIIDTDVVTHSLYNYPSEAMELIGETFGSEYIVNNQIDRKALGERVFNDKDELKKLNNIIHPLVRKTSLELLSNYQKQEAKNQKNYLLAYVIPLYFETGRTYEVDKVVLAYCPFETQLERLKKRQNIDEPEALKRIRSQIPIEEKVNLSDVIINTNQDLIQVKEQVKNFLDSMKWDAYETD